MPFDEVCLEVQEVQVGRQSKILWQTTGIKTCIGINGWSGMYEVFTCYHG